MDLKNLLHLVERNKVLIALTTLLGVLFSIVFIFLATPQYTAKGQLFVSTPSQALDLSALVQGSGFSEQRVKSYAQIINGPETLNPVIKQLGLSVTADQLASAVSASAPLGSVLINLSVTNQSPQLAAKLVDAIGKQFGVTVASLESGQTESTNAIKVTLVRSAVVPKTPTSPNTTLNLLLGLVLGLGVGIGVSLLRQSFDTTIKNENDLGGAQLLAAVLFDELASENPLITQISRYAARTESMRQLRTNLQFGNKEKRPKVITFTSALPGEGKTSICVNLGLSKAAAGASVLIIEADMRRPKMHTYLGMENNIEGLADLLAAPNDEQVNTSSIIQFPEVNNLWVLNAGTIPNDPSELLHSIQFEHLIDTFRKKYDFVLIDTPPLLPVSDAAIISRVCDGFVVVVHAGETRRNQYMGVVGSLNQVRGNIFGVVINMIPTGSESADYGYRYSSSYYGGYRGYRGYRGYSSTDPSKDPYGLEINAAGKEEITVYAPAEERTPPLGARALSQRGAGRMNAFEKVAAKFSEATDKLKKKDR